MTAPAALSPKQRLSIIQADAPVNIWAGAVRSGKTLASILAWLDFVRQAPPGKLLMVGKTLQTLERNVLDEMAAYFPARLKAVEHTNGASTARVLGREVITLGANDARAESRIRGITLAGAYVDELTLLPDEGYWLQLLARLSVDGARLYGTTNPDNPTHWLKRGPIDKAAEWGFRHWHFTLDDNPALTDEYVARMKATHTGLWFKRNILGLWVLAEGAIYDMVDWTGEGEPIVKANPRREEVEAWHVAIDYGTAGTTVAILLAACTDRIVAVHEWRWVAAERQRQLTDAAVSTELRAWLDTAVTADLGYRPTLSSVVIDPSASSLITQLCVDRWPRVTPADNSVVDGIRTVASLFALDRLHIHQRCRGLIDEMAGYVWDPKAAEKGEDKPIKAADHGPDALRYGLMALYRVWRWWIEQTVPTVA